MAKKITENGWTTPRVYAMGAWKITKFNSWLKYSMKIMVVGAWLAGCSVARLLKNMWHDVFIVEKNNHIWWNCYDERIDGICVHKFWPHIFHTNDKEVRDFLSQYTERELYQHRVKSYVDGNLITLPIWPVTKKELGTEDSSVLYEKLIKNYTEKQRWFQNESAKARLKEINDYDTRYFKDKYQWIPKQWYARMLQKMAEDIPLFLNCDVNKINNRYEMVIRTGRIDEFYNNKFGELEYHCTKFDHKRIEWTLQPVAQINYPNDYDFIRVTEHKHWYNITKNFKHSVVTYEYPRQGDTPCYPVNNEENQEKLKKYQNIKNQNTYFLWRLWTYQYMDMWQVVRQALDFIKDSWEFD